MLPENLDRKEKGTFGEKILSPNKSRQKNDKWTTEQDFKMNFKETWIIKKRRFSNKNEPLARVFLRWISPLSPTLFDFFTAMRESQDFAQSKI